MMQPSPGRDSHSMCSLRRFINSLIHVSIYSSRNVNGGYDLRYAASAKPQVCSQIAALGIGTLEMKASALNQPLHLELDAGINEAVEISAGVLER